ncbi:MAG: alpha/beta hydrolase family protein [Candidatus Limiplasma sp.]|nr:alpha/beta hydrolase family protein [Candidatus Limiplasma sp.]MEA5144785.1 alpha/beta hydrolase family protein [Candidatus Limiplasma sp.]
MAHLDCSFNSPALQKNAHLIVFVPSMSADDYLADREVDYTQAHWPTLYLLHGSYGDCMDWSLRTGIERYAQDKGIAVVMPSAENSTYVTMAHGEDYLTYVGKELPEFLPKILPLSRERAKTYIAGLSMGGYGAFRIALAYPETFGYAASLSGALDIALLHDASNEEAHMRKMPANYRRAVFADNEGIRGTEDDLAFLLRQRVREKARLPALYMSCGTEDFILPANDNFFAASQEAQVPVTFERYPGVHDWVYWDTHIQDVLRWLPS